MLTKIKCDPSKYMFFGPMSSFLVLFLDLTKTDRIGGKKYQFYPPPGPFFHVFDLIVRWPTAEPCGKKPIASVTYLQI